MNPNLATPASATAPRPVARLHIEATDSYLQATVEILDGAQLQPKDSPVDLYLAPIKNVPAVTQTERTCVPSKELYHVALDCGHSIDEDKVVLHRNTSLPGNALGQLSARLSAVRPSCSVKTIESKVKPRAELTETEARVLADAYCGTNLNGRMKLIRAVEATLRGDIPNRPHL